jgi:histidinol-phosphatase
MDARDLKARLEFAVDATRAAGKHTLKHFQQGIAVERKADDSPVTIADREAEKLLRAAAAAKYPDDGILGEELGEIPGRSGYRWIFDPIDGTKSFISGVPLYSTLVGLEYEGESVLGVILIPALDECVCAAKGQGAWYIHGSAAAVPARVSKKDRLRDSLFVTSEVKTYSQFDRGGAYDRLQSAAWLTRTWGDGYGYLLVATGRAELMVDPKMSIWDCAALQPVIEEAGGKFTDWIGRPTIHSGEAIASNGLVHAEALALMK